MSDLTDLIARLEAAPKGSRELDAQIAAATFDDPEHPNAKIRLPHWDEGCPAGTYWRHSHDVSLCKSPHYTTSIDMADKLRPNGYALEIGHCPEMGVFVRCYKGAIRVDSSGAPSGNHKTSEPIARCIAALRAREEG